MLNIIKRIFNALPNSQKNQPMIRWTPEHLAEMKNYLETKPPETLQREDWYLVIEFLAQRYCSENSPRTEVDWQARLGAVYKKIDDGFDNPGDVKAPIYLPRPGVIVDAGDLEFTQWMNDVLSKK